MPAALKMNPLSAVPASRPQLELSGPVLRRAFETLVEGAESQGGVESWIDALKLKSRLFRQTLIEKEHGPVEELPTEVFKSLCTFMASVRRRIAPYLEKPYYSELTVHVADLIQATADSRSTDAAMADFCSHFPNDRSHRWVRDLAAECLHNSDPERFPMMCRWI